MVEGIGAKLHAVLKPGGVKDAARNFAHLLKAGQLPQGILGRLLEHDQRLDRDACVEAVGRGAMPGGAPGRIARGRALDKADIAVDDGGTAVLRPALGLGGLADAGRPQKQDAAAVVVNGGAVELDHLAADGVGVEKLKQKQIAMFSSLDSQE